MLIVPRRAVARRLLSGVSGNVNACVQRPPDTSSCAACRQGSTLRATAGRGLAARIPLREERFRVRPLAQAPRTGAHCLLRPGDCTSVSRSRFALAAGTRRLRCPASVGPGALWSVPLLPRPTSPARARPTIASRSGGARSARSEYPAVVLDKEETRGRAAGGRRRPLDLGR